MADSLDALRLERLRQLRALRLKADTIEAGVARYADDPAGFAANCIDWRGVGLAPYQEDALSALPEHRRVCVRGPHGLGKTTTAAATILWFALTREAAGKDWKIVTTASAWRQLIHYLWPEIHKWARRLDWDRVRKAGPFTSRELLNLHIRLLHGEAFAVASSNPAKLEGAHADEILFVFDEAKAIPAMTFDACEGALSTGNAYVLAISTPGEPNGRFYDIQSRKAGYEDWHVIHVTLDQAVAAGRVSGDWAEQRRRQWGETSAIYHNRVLGEFYASDEDAVIPLSWVEQAIERWHEWDDAGRPEPPGRRVVGVDVARYGEDKTVLAIRQGYVVQELRVSSKEDTMATVGRVKAVATWPKAFSIVDVIGVGAGVVDRLREQGFPVVAFNAATSAQDARDSTDEFGFTNLRAAAWWSLREQLDPSAGATLALPDDDELVGDLTAPHWKVTSGGNIQIESKDDLRKRIGRSTDLGDAVVQSCWIAGGVGGDGELAIPYTDAGELPPTDLDDGPIRYDVAV